MSTVENIIPKKFICKQCNKSYKDKTGLWYHNKKHHTCNSSNITQNSDLQFQQSSKKPRIDVTNINNIQCEYCKKNFSRNDNLKRHYNICKTKNKSDKKETENNTLLEHIKILTLKIEQLEKNINKPQTVNNFNGPINNTINICNVGDENIKLLTEKEKKYIKLEELNSIVAIVDKLNFNERLPQHHNFYTSAINDKYANTIDKSTDKIIKQPKKDLFDKLLVSSMKKLEQIAKEEQNTKKNKDFLIAFERLKDFIFLKKGKKVFHEQINTLSYNKREMVANTLSKIVADYTIKQEDIPIKLDAEINKIVDIPEDQCLSNQNDNDSDSDSDYDGSTLKISKV